MSCLLVIKGAQIGVTYPLEERTRIGRLGENEVQVSDPNVSRLHAEIVKNRMAYILYDRGSRNGVMVNGEPVTERVLLRNDEIRIGNTVFLFNSDLNIRNARFSNNSVYIYPAENETLQENAKRSSLDQLNPRERESIEFIIRFAELFGGKPTSLSETAHRLARQVIELLHADAAVLFMKEYAGAEMRPIIALPEDRSVGINRGLVSLVAEEKTAMLTSEHTFHPPATPEETRLRQPGEEFTPSLVTTSRGNKTVDSTLDLPDEESEAAGSVPLSTLCAPLLDDDQNVMGVLVVEKMQLQFYSLRDLGLLQAICRLATGMLEAARLADQLALQKQERLGEENDALYRSAPIRSLRMQEIFNAAKRTADSDVTVLITGESGTGKEILARFIHENSPRAQGPFVAVNCGAIPANLFESDMFGYEKGAFTGAVKTTAGKVEAAQGGTLFLDEIGELDVALQPKLLRFLQDRAIYRVGGNRAIETNVRIVAATNADLAAGVRSGAFREDLWYRLNVVPFHLPPLRERREDILTLVEFLIARYSTRFNKKVLGANDGALMLLQKYDWPGNIRELENAVERAVLLADGRILTAGDFSHIEEARRRAMGQADLERKRDTKPLSEVERQHIIVALKKHNYNQARAAEALGLHRNTLRNKIIEYGIEISK